MKLRIRVLTAAEVGINHDNPDRAYPPAGAFQVVGHTFTKPRWAVLEVQQQDRDGQPIGAWEQVELEESCCSSSRCADGVASEYPYKHSRTSFFTRETHDAQLDP